MTETTSDWDAIIVQPLMTTLASASEGDLRAFIELAVRRAEVWGEAGLELFAVLQAEMAGRVRAHRVMVEDVGEAWEALRRSSRDPDLQAEIVERDQADTAFAKNVSETVAAQDRRDPIEAIKAAEALMQRYGDAIARMDAAKAAEARWRRERDMIEGRRNGGGTANRRRDDLRFRTSAMSHGWGTSCPTPTTGRGFGRDACVIFRTELIHEDAHLGFLPTETGEAPGPKRPAARPAPRGESLWAER